MPDNSLAYGHVMNDNFYYSMQVQILAKNGKTKRYTIP